MSFSRRSFLIASLAVASPVLAYADDAKKPLPPTPGPDAKPEAIVKTLYDSYLADQGFDYMSDKLRPRYFTSATADLLKKVFARSEAENEPGIDYEPLIDGQDGDVKGLAIVTTATAADKSTVEARFTSFEDKLTVIFDFVTENGAWKIDDIRNKQGNSLKAVAKDFLQ
jgi:hypothetical protein